MEVRFRCSITEEEITAAKVKLEQNDPAMPSPDEAAADGGGSLSDSERKADECLSLFADESGRVRSKFCEIDGDDNLSEDEKRSKKR